MFYRFTMFHYDIYKNLSYYLYYTNPSNSIKLNNHMNNCKGEVSFEDIAFVVSDFQIIY